MKLDRLPYFSARHTEKQGSWSPAVKPHSILAQDDGRVPSLKALRTALQVVNTTLSHEVYNELAPIYVLSEMLLKRSADPEVRSACEIINNSAKSIKGIIASLQNIEQMHKIPVTEYLPGTLMIDLDSPDIRHST